MSKIRVYRYGLLPPHENAELVREQMRLAHKYRNTLVEIERKRRSDLRALASAHPALSTLEDAANKHAHRQPRTVNPVLLSATLNLNGYSPQSPEDSLPATKHELDFLLNAGWDTTQVKTTGEAQHMIKRMSTRVTANLATPLMLKQLMLNLGYPEEKAMTMSKGQAGLLIGKRIRYKEPKPEYKITACYCNATSHPPCAYCERGAGSEVD